jgi:hypothetical protein
MSVFWLSYALLWFLVVAESLLVFALLRELGRIYLSQPQSIARDGLTPGTMIPEILVEGRRKRAPLQAFLSAPYTLLICALPDCPFCEDVIEKAQRWSRRRPNIGALVVISGSERGKYDAFETVEVALAAPNDVLYELRVRASPFLFVVGSDGEVLSKGLANSHRDIRGLLEAAGVFDEARREGAISRSPTPTVHGHSH